MNKICFYVEKLQLLFIILFISLVHLKLVDFPIMKLTSPQVYHILKAI